MTNRQYRESLTDYELAQQLIVHHRSAEQSYYMTSDDTIFEFTDGNMNDAWKAAILHEIKWLESEKE